MKKLLTALFVLIPSLGFCDSKISSFPSTTTLNTNDIIPVVTVNGGLANKTITFQNFQGSIVSTITANSLGALTTSSATATYLQLSSATATYLQQSSATANYIHTLTTTNGIVGGGTGGNLIISVSSISLSTQVVGNLPTANLNSGTNADSSHFWRGDGLWISSSTFGSSGPALASTNTWTGGNTFQSTTTFVNEVKVPNGSISTDAAAFGQLVASNITGATTNTAAPAGKIGEIIESKITTQADYPATTHYGDLTSITLTAGNWIISAQTRTNSASSTGLSAFVIGVSVTTGDSSTGLTEGDNALTTSLGTAVFGATNDLSSSFLVGLSVSLSGSTTYYLKYSATYSNGQPKAVGRITAVRVS